MKKTPVRKIHHEEPSAESLLEIPETPADAKWERNSPILKRIQASIRKHGIIVQPDGEEPRMLVPPMGPPRKGEAPRPTKGRTVRLTAEEWQRLERRAAKDGATLHAAMRAALLRYAKTG